MKTLQALTKSVCHWWHQSLGLYLKRFFRRLNIWLRAVYRPWLPFLNRWLPLEEVSLASLTSSNTAIRQSTTALSRSAGGRSASRPVPPHQTQLIILLSVLLLTAGLGQRFYNQPVLGVDAIAPETIVAPDSATLIDKETTEANRRAARNGTIQILMPDAEVTQKAKQDADVLMRQAAAIRKQVGRFPYLSTSTLSTTTQRYLRQSSDEAWNIIWDLAQRTEVTLTLLDQGTPTGGPLQERLNNLNAEQKTAIRELLRYRQRVSPQAFLAVGTQIQANRLQYKAAQEKLASLSLTKPPMQVESQLLELNDFEWQATQRTVRQVLHRMLTQGIHPGIPDDLRQQAVKAQLQGTASFEMERVAAELITAVLRPNLIEDPERTRLRAEQAVEEVEPVTVSIDEDAVIVERGDRITQEDFVLLDHFGLTRRRFNRLGFAGFGLLVGCCAALFLWLEHARSSGLRQRDHVLVMLLALSVAGLMALNTPTLGLPAVGLLVSSFYGALLGIVAIGMLVLLLPIGANVALIPLAAGAIAALVGVWFAPKLRSREEFALLGGFVGLAQGVSHLLLTLMFNAVSASAWYNLLIASAMQGVYGVLWSIVALGISPYLESVFDVVTPIRLAELSNPNRPLLKRLASEAPGTFQHTMFVANLAEAAARALGHNVELVRAGTLYHDIGKMHDPKGFIENQMDEPNKHDLINNPWTSADIIKKHVTLGLVMARKHRLPKAIRAFIPEHQGSMLISYFYHQAKQICAENPDVDLREADFRYDGPIPQSPETGIVMLADSCEAALRSLSKDASLEEAYSMVNKILRARWKDNQLIDSSLTRDNMTVIAKIFVQVWQQYNHKRIAYPKGALATPGR
ncbi:MAG: HDIG domain-containing protein [Leptolyngbya sp. SIO4C1]|nr:HDIG domain-containing protein [Leptolyngbya sp. SIO4C1]